MNDRFAYDRSALSGPAVVIAVILLIAIAAGGYLYIPQVKQSLQKVESDGSNKSPGSSISTSATSTNAPITPISVSSMYVNYSINQASADAAYSGKTLFVSDGNIINVFKDQNSNYASVHILNATLSLFPDEEVLFVWRDQSAASSVPTNGADFIASCTIGGLQNPDSSNEFDGFAAYGPVLVLNSCAVAMTQPQYCTSLLAGITITNYHAVYTANGNFESVSAIIHNSGSFPVTAMSFGTSPSGTYQASGEISEVVAAGSQTIINMTSPIFVSSQPQAIELSFAPPTAGVAGFVWTECQLKITASALSSSSATVSSTAAATSSNQTSSSTMYSCGYVAANVTISSPKAIVNSATGQATFTALIDNEGNVALDGQSSVMNAARTTAWDGVIFQLPPSSPYSLSFSHGSAVVGQNYVLDITFILPNGEACQSITIPVQATEG